MEAGRITVKALLIYLCVAFVVVFIWTDPRGHAPIIGRFLGDAGHLCMVAMQKLADFLGGL